MEIRTVSDSVAIYSDGKRLQVIHDLGDEIVLDKDNQADLLDWYKNPGGGR
ncbi:TPA: hypothetical protein U0908_000600 [Streptococcus suis 14A]|uniref:hypothetical protein n=1 Tax=Streptococcus suis TaxID=1307 RepID=UPI00041A682A|nr:hypothetical protein [Streptococcus suis]HEM3198439.1 hypothetical protein [Streptococcus suis 14A]HEM5273268.1 hypothetical protein [Streptococcus suis]HEM5278618.1 hypothetical protein [Streptococcus suis]